MTTLHYRGNYYIQRQQLSTKKNVELKYRRRSLNQKKKEISHVLYQLKYRGSNYHSKVTQIKEEEKSTKKDSTNLFSIARELIDAQFKLGDEELCRRLWEEVGEHEIDPERVINLMYSCSSNTSDESMTEADSRYYIHNQ